VDLAAAAAEAAQESVPPALRAEGTLEVGPLPLVPGDAAQLRRLLGCLLSNAFKFRRPGVPPRVSVSGRPAPGGALEVAVADNGIGFEAEHAERIFEPFQRLHRRTDYEGSGLGLALAARLAANHGGSLRARAVLGEGAVFTLTLPLKRGG
jgi:signal transduction histidine kinase